ncbi:MAG: TlpA family protein disulfide reductase [Dysgonamonadaceae bacterium]|nr:TlpA family protein disulfide reductase [Dysgonamonadaceae bacterium]
MKFIRVIVILLLPLWIQAQNIPTWKEIETDKNFIALQQAIASSTERIKAIENEYSLFSTKQKNDRLLVKALKERYDCAVEERDGILFDFIEKHPESYISLVVIAQLHDENRVDKLTVDSVYNRLSASVRETDFGKALGASIKTLLNSTVGSKAADFVQRTPDGTPVKLSDFRGKYVLVDFWASWCAPCRRENPNLVKAYKKYRNKNFTVLGISLDKSKQAWLAAIKNDGLEWTQVSDLKLWENEAAKLFGVQSIPQNMLIDPDGIIIRKNLRGEELQKALSEILK